MKDIKENPRFVTMPQVHPAQVDCLCTVPGYPFMKEIKLTQGKVALVDDEDFEYLNQFKWSAHKNHKNYYASRHLSNRKFIRMHRFIINPPDNMQVDHINHNGLDNRRCNLRIVTNRENHCNLKNQKEYIGVNKRGNRFMTLITIKNRTVYLGYFKTPELAHEAYMKKFNELQNEKRGL